MKQELGRIHEMGYSSNVAKVVFRVYWYSEEKQKEHLIMLPEIVSPDLTFEIRAQSIAVIDTILYFSGHSGDFNSELLNPEYTYLLLKIAPDNEQQ